MNKNSYRYRSLLAGLSLMASAVLPLTASAESQRFFDYGRVLSAEPIYQTFQHRTPRETCWTETVRTETPYQQHHQRHNSATGTIVGGIIGGAIGHAVGHGKSNKKVGAVVGSVLGMSIGNDISRRNSHNRYPHSNHREVRYDDVERCDVSYETTTEEKLIGYDVAYKYKGETYYTRTDQHPGRKIKLAVSVSPVNQDY